MEKFRLVIKFLLLYILALIFLHLLLLEGDKKSLQNDIEDKSPTEVYCTADAKMCPDGSFVGRQAPNCEFAKCPGE